MFNILIQNQMKKCFFLIGVCSLFAMMIACNNAKPSSVKVEDELSVQQRAEKILSETAQAFKGVDLENDEEGFSEAVIVLEKALDEAYDCYETDEQKKEFSKALGEAIKTMDANGEVKMVCGAHIRIY